MESRPLTFILFAAGSLLIAWVSAWGSRWWTKRADTRRRVDLARKAKLAESDAEALAEQLGYAIVGRQVVRKYPLRVGGDVFEVELRVDLVLKKDNELFLAEVKSGDRAPDVQHAPTRRQLLEYAYAFDVEEILLFDMTARTVHPIRFPAEDPVPTENNETSGSPPPTREAGFWLIIAGMILGLGAATIEPVDEWLHQVSGYLAQVLSTDHQF